MTSLLFCLSVSVGWAQDKPTQNPVEATVSQTIDGLISTQSLNIGITTLSMKSGSKNVVQFEGAAQDKASIKQLIDALESEPSTLQPYLVSITSTAIDGEPRDLFVMTTRYAGQ